MEEPTKDVSTKPEAASAPAETTVTPTVAKSPALSLPTAIVIAALILGIAWVVGRAPWNNAGNAPAAPDTSTAGLIKTVLATKGSIPVAPVTAADHIQGATTPKVTLIEYSDLECPYCKVFNATTEQLLQKYGSSIALVYRHYPLDCVDNTDPQCTPLHPKARAEAIAAECAAAQGGSAAFFKFTNGVFAVTPSNNGLDPAQLPKIAASIGLDVNAFNLCLKNPAPAAAVSANAKEAIKDIQVQGTPTTIIVDNKSGKTYRVDGAYPYDVVAGVIEKLIK